MEPNDAKLSRGMALHQQGRLAEAEKLYREVLQRSPKQFEALYLLGLTALASDRHQRGVDLIDRAIKQNPGFPPGWCNRGLGLMQLGRLTDALDSFDKALALQPDFAEAWYNRGVSLKDLKRPEQALASFEAALAIRPDDPEALNNRGLVLIEMRRYAAALASLDQALALRPRFPEALCNRGNALTGLKRPADAIGCYDQAIALWPDLAEAHCNRGNALHELNRPDAACASFSKALALQPDLAEAHFGLSLTLLALGHYQEGFGHHEWRKKRANPEGARSFPQPLWLGDKTIKGRTLFIHPELFLGDMINFSRYAALADSQGAKVILAVQEPLRQLLTTLGSAIRIIGASESPDRFDFHCPLMSLPLAFRTSIDTVPATIPYLHADPDKVMKWQRKLGEHGFRVGICWQGSAASVEMDRAFPLACFQQIVGLPDIRLISLQTGEGSEQLASMPEGMKVESYDTDARIALRPFVETAAMMQNLDLIITSDTAIAHLAGALGRPTWIVLKPVPDWRWGLQGDTTPWYPTARLFRQKQGQDWSHVFAEIHAALEWMIDAQSKATQP